jgi:hypothetical protein
MATHAIPTFSLDEVLAEPRYFPVRADFARDRLVFVETGRTRLAPLPFIDGRFPLASGEPVEVRLGDALQAKWSAPAGPDRFIFHVAFCGSTLLATLLDAPGRSFGQREPQILNDIADACGSRPRSTVVAALGLTRSLLRRPWQPGERNFCKPSNWANNLLPTLTRHSHRIRPLFVAIDDRDYLVAMFRGGRERVEYVFRATRHLLGHNLKDRALWEDALRAPGPALDVAARIGLLSLHRQLGLFGESMRRGGWSSANLLSLRQIEDDPLCACMLAERALGLGVSWAEINRAIDRHANGYAKVPGEPYSREARRQLNAQIERDYATVFDRALDWAAGAGLQTNFGSLLRFVETQDRAA